MKIITSPWSDTFDEFASSIQKSAIIAAPYITRQSVERLAEKLQSRRKSVRLDILTDMNADSLIEGSVDIGALAWLCTQVSGTTVRHLRSLHAKAYVADGHTAIVTSANLTNGGLSSNHELGVAITDPSEVKKISEALREYGNLGMLVPLDVLVELDGMAQQAKRGKATVDAGVPVSLKADYEVIWEDLNERLAKLRTDGIAPLDAPAELDNTAQLVELRTPNEAFITDSDKPITAQFCDAVKYVLRHHGPQSTRDMGPLVQQLLPQHCNDQYKHIASSGNNYGRKWKHRLRAAQVQLRKQGIIDYDEVRNGKWWLT